MYLAWSLSLKTKKLSRLAKPEVTFVNYEQLVIISQRGGGLLWISSDGDDQMGAKIKMPQNP